MQQETTCAMTATMMSTTYPQVLPIDMDGSADRQSDIVISKARHDGDQ